MIRYDFQLKILSGALRRIGAEELNIYDIDGTIARYMRGSKRMHFLDDMPALVRAPVGPYALLSARAAENMEKTRLWCDTHMLRPLVIFHRFTDIWSIEKGNISCYKAAILGKIREVLPGIKLTVYDDDVIPLTKHIDDIRLVTVARI